jgi:hypothetical protein
MFPLGGTTRSNSTGPPPRRRDSRDLALGLVIVFSGRDRGDLWGDQGRRQPPLEQRAIFERNGLEPLRGHDRQLVVQARVRPLLVIVPDPGIHRGLRIFDRGERPDLVEEVRPECAVEPLHLPVLVRRRRRGQPVGDRVLTTDLVEQHLPALAEPVGELLAV